MLFRSKKLENRTTYRGRGTERSITCRIRKACDRGRFGRSYRGIWEGISYTNMANYKRFHLTFNDLQILQTVSEEFKNPIQQALPAELSPHFQKGQAVSAQFELRFLPWSHYERHIRVEDKEAPLKKVRHCLTFLNLIFRITIHFSIKPSLFLA